MHRLELAAALPVVGIGYRVARPARRREAILGVIAVGERAIACEIAIAIVSRDDGANPRVLVECVSGVEGRARGRRVEPPAIVGRALTDTPIGGVVAVIEGRAAGGGRGLARRR